MSKKILSLLALCILLVCSIVISSCFREPIVGPPIIIETPKPFVVPIDSMRFTIRQNDDLDNEAHPEFFVTPNNGGDSSYAIIDTSDVIPKLTLRLRLQPVPLLNDNSISSVFIKIDSVPITGIDRVLLNNENVVFIVKKVEKPITYARLGVVQTKLPPYTKEDSFADIFPWKVTAKNEIRMSFQAQTKYLMKISSTGNTVNTRARVGGNISIRY